MPFATFFSRPLSAFRASFSGAKPDAAAAAPPTLDFPGAPPDIRQLVRERQYAHIVRPADGIAFDPVSLRYAWQAIDHDMAYVPGGDVTLCGEYATTSEEGFVLVPQVVGTSQTDSIYLDRWCVTNADFHRFVQAGGYENVSLWPEQILASVLKFVDKTGQPGPAFWENGRPAKATAAHPVVGVSWYEANAYAQWVGKRLPTSAEWQRAGTWGSTGSDSLKESKYPWGNSFDPQFANTWASGRHQTVSVHECQGGNTPNGIRQLIGNVWEWMNTQYLLAATEEITVHMTDPMAEVRGGAFDSYFHSHTTCQSRSAQTLLARKNNVGFRCCFSAEGLDPHGDDEMQSADA
ncbi:formylglycine-generating enzyme family protein [Stieleria sp. ICT_E10.1]|uniref:formylglycine-generating enzyme family protein n=1 Tax=Stieleria sedimenti TaxID=2976331 RepID=UPI00217FAADC|nr:formylglycine-generating enzyme family protein [Stieleria sedimenti]MCS7469299.1 formylglycine-generating enzyme family protein [Stieleria sedimenti]